MCVCDVVIYLHLHAARQLKRYRVSGSCITFAIKSTCASSPPSPLHRPCFTPCTLATSTWIRYTHLASLPTLTIIVLYVAHHFLWLFSQYKTQRFHSVANGDMSENEERLRRFQGCTFIEYLGCRLRA